MVSTTDISKVFDLLKTSRDVEKIEKIDEDLTTSIQPDRRLIEDWEPGFMGAYEFLGGVTLEHLIAAYQDNEQILLVGPSGVGKSTIAFHILDHFNSTVRALNRKILKENIKLLKTGVDSSKLLSYHALPYDMTHYSCHEETRSAELIGDVLPIYNNDGTRHIDMFKGAVVEAWTEGKTLILEEIDFALPGVWGQTHQFFDMRTRETMIFINGQHRIQKHKDFRVIASANTKGQGENIEEFAGTQVLNNAFLNRFTYVVEVTWLPHENEITLVNQKTGLDKTIIKKMVGNVAEKSRAAYDADTLDTPISTRDLMSWAREIKRRQKTTGMNSSDANFWKEICAPSADPAFLRRIADDTSRDTIREYMNII